VTRVIKNVRGENGDPCRGSRRQSLQPGRRIAPQITQISADQLARDIGTTSPPAIEGHCPSVPSLCRATASVACPKESVATGAVALQCDRPLKTGQARPAQTRFSISFLEMKTILLALVAVASLSISASAQDFVAPLPPPERVPPEEVAPPAVDGALPRAVRSGNPLQMVNPAAPREYGSGTAHVDYVDRDPFLETQDRRPRPIGIRLFTFEF
jgi:hypothetical protein